MTGFPWENLKQSFCIKTLCYCQQTTLMQIQKSDRKFRLKKILAHAQNWLKLITLKFLKILNLRIFFNDLYHCAFSREQ